MSAGCRWVIIKRTPSYTDSDDGNQVEILSLVALESREFLYRESLVRQVPKGSRLTMRITLTAIMRPPKTERLGCHSLDCRLLTDISTEKTAVSI